MHRNRSETVLRCLEMALHPNTADDEVLAAINACRRIVVDRPLREVWTALAGPAADGDAAEADLARLRQQNRELDDRLAAAKRAAANAAERLGEAHAQLDKLREDLRLARAEGAAAERQFAAFRAAEGQIAERRERDIGELRRALERARRPAAAGAAANFGAQLTSALQRGSPRPPAAGSAAGVAQPSPWIA